MRHVVYVLVVLNLVFLGWNIFQSQSDLQAGRTLPPLPETVAPLVTLQEQQAADNAVSAIEEITATEPPGAGAGLLCQTLGPFLALEEVQQIKAPETARVRDIIEAPDGSIWFISVGNGAIYRMIP